jgi:hypothetical protein
MKKFFLAAIFLGLMFGTVGAANAKDHAAVDSQKKMLIYNGYAGESVTKSVSPWKKILSTTIDAEDCDDKAFLVSVSGVTGIFSQNLNVATSTDLRLVVDAARIQVAVKIDGKWATPGPVTFDSAMHYNEQSSVPGFINIDMSGQTAAHSFNFYQVGVADTDDDDHTVEVFARVSLDATALSLSGLDSTQVTAVVGSRTLIVETAYVDTDENSD